RHKDLWLDDGTLVIAAEGVLFRVYMSLLARHSDVFKEMFSLPQPATSLVDQVDGCPLVTFHDTASDAAHMLQ
ncbi:hypothetical protein FA95DRAFT_1476849, partial [Auriscalpium vulgare]